MCVRVCLCVYVCVLDSDASHGDGKETLRRTRAVDVFALGCVLYNVLDAGGHPFGHDIVRNGNILHGKVRRASWECPLAWWEGFYQPMYRHRIP